MKQTLLPFIKVVRMCQKLLVYIIFIFLVQAVVLYAFLLCDKI